MRPTLCDTFRSRSFWTWDMLARGRSVDCQIGEETLTDINILELKIRHSSEVYSQTFNKIEEGSNGADWEWWFTGSSKKWIGFRVQAKVIDFKTNSFNHLHYKKPKSPQYQCDSLIENCLRQSPRLIPLYCLYSNWNSVNHFPWNFSNSYTLEESYGCSILSAFAVRYLRSKTKITSFKSLLNYMIPWHCLVCCHGNTVDDLAHRVFKNWKNLIIPIENLILEELDESIIDGLNSDIINGYRNNYDNEIRLLDKPPEYVNLLLNNEFIEQPDPNVRMLTIFQEQEEIDEF